MALPWFKKQQKKGDTAAQEEQKSTLVPIGSQEEKAAEKEPKKAPPPQQRTWRTFPIGSNAVIQQPSTTEKAMRLSSGGKYVFEVSKRANKLSIKKAFFNTYGVMPAKVAVIRQDGKTVRYGKHAGVRRAVKKAIITVPKGKTIDIGI